VGDDMRGSDIVTRLKTFIAPENWDADLLVFDAVKEIERLRSAKLIQNNWTLRLRF
jgi:hypothetical protein